MRFTQSNNILLTYCARNLLTQITPVWLNLISNKDKLWLRQLIQASCNALLNLLRLLLTISRLPKALCKFESHGDTIMRSSEY